MKNLSYTLFIIFFFTSTLFAQEKFQVKDRNFLETKIFDREGNAYSLDDLRYDMKKTRGINPVCTAGIFRLHFDDAGTNTGFDDPTQGASRAAVACQVYSDLSVLINESPSPYSSIPNLGNGTSYVEIHVQSSINAASNPMLGNAGQYFMTTSQGIVHGTIWQTINTGIDAWFGINASNFGNQGIYHGQMQLNFGHPFYTGTSATAIPSTQYDLYSVILHEAIHALGIGSLIAHNGTSKLTNSNPGIYSYYDTKLFAGTTALINWDFCYGANFVGNTAQLTTPCTIQYNVSSPLWISSDATWSNGTSLSHFPAACGNTGSLVMNPGMSVGTTKRFPDEREVKALCTLGYSTSGQYPGATYTPAAQCGGTVAGTNDYATYTTSAPGTNYSFPANTPVTIYGNDILGNDANATFYGCVEVVNGSGTLSGNLMGGLGSSFVFTPATNFAGTAILKYIPQQSAQLPPNNITYIFIDITPPPLPPCSSPNPCQMMCYGGFEEFTSQAQYDVYTYGGYTNNNYPSFSYYPAQYPDNSPDFRQGQMGLPSHINCGSSTTFVNANTGTNYVGMILRNTSTTMMNNPEGPALPLNGSVLPGESVTITLWARVGSPLCNGGVEARLINQAPCMGNGGTLLSACAGLVQSDIDSSGPVSGTAYQLVTMHISNTTNVAMTHLLINSLPYTPYTAQPFGFVFIDDVSVIKDVPELEITKIGPSEACPGDTLEYTITVKNNATTSAFNIQIKDSMSTGLSYVSGGSFSFPTQTISTLAASAIQSYTLRALVNSSTGTETNIAKVISGACMSDSSLYQVNTVINPPSLQLSSVLDKADPCRGDTVNMSVEVCNYDQDTVNNISIQSTIPVGYTPLTGTGYNISGNLITWNNFNLLSGTITNPSCTTLVCKLKLGSSNASICQDVIAGGNTCANSQDCLAVNFDNCWPQALEQMNGINYYIHCYPNPNRGKVNFEIYVSTTGSLQLFNALGQLVFETLVEKGNNLLKHEIEIPGLYEFRLKSANTVLKNGRFIVR